MTTPYSPPDRPWMTSDELDYLSRIGRWSGDRGDRTQLLTNYLKGLDYRPKSERYLDFERLRERAEELLDQQ